MRQAVDELHQAGQLFYGVWGTGVLVETLLERGAEGDLAEAQEAIDRLANLSADDGSAMREITLLRLRALLARARGDDVAYRDLVNRYRAMAESLGFEGHIDWAKALIEAGIPRDRWCLDDGGRWRAHHAALGCGRTPSSVTSAVRRTAASADTAEYKQVTVLFADVVRSMDIAATVDVERLREIMTELVERSAAVVQRYGGTVEYNGDGVMALFGAPVALEDHAFRACLAALAIQEEANRLAAEVARRDGVALQLRVGLNSGRVIAGEIGSGSLGYAATGESVGYGATDGIGGAPGRGDAVGVDRATGRAHRDAGRTGVGAHQGGRRTGVRAPAGGDRPAAMAWSGAPRRAWSVGAGRWRPSTPWWTARSVAAVVW